MLYSKSIYKPLMVCIKFPVHTHTHTHIYTHTHTHIHTHTHTNTHTYIHTHTHLSVVLVQKCRIDYTQSVLSARCINKTLSHSKPQKRLVYTTAIHSITRQTLMNGTYSTKVHVASFSRLPQRASESMSTENSNVVILRQRL